MNITTTDQGDNYEKIILEEMELSPDFANWGIEISSSGLNGKVIEIGCGLGRNLEFLKKHCTDLWGCDYREEYISYVESNKYFMQGKTILWDICQPPNFQTEFDSFFCSNVIEHIEDDQKAICNIARIPKIKGGVIIVPALSHIYNRIDKNLSHYRRYDKKELNQKLTNAGFKIVDIFTFNKIGTLGWIWQGMIFKKDTLGKENMKIFNKLMPIIRKLDIFIPFPGLSLIAIIEKNK